MDTSLLIYMAAGLRRSDGTLNLGRLHMALHLALAASQRDNWQRERECPFPESQLEVVWPFLTYH